MKQRSLKKTALACAVTLYLLGFSNCSYAKYEVNLTPMFTLVVYEPIDGKVLSNDNGSVATDALDPALLRSLKESFGYFERLISRYATNSNPVKIALFPKATADSNAYASTKSVTDDLYKDLTTFNANIFFNFIDKSYYP